MVAARKIELKLHDINAGPMALQVRFNEDNLIEAGIDEAGRGCLWGPMFAAAVIWPPEDEWLDEHREIAPKIVDSKKLHAKKRTYVAQVIQSYAIDYSVGTVSPKEIDEYGMTYCNRLVFTRAIDGLSVSPNRLLIDGILALEQSDLEKREIDEQETIVEGDGKYLPIAAASILAKESRDTAVKEWVDREPELQERYALKSGMGYGTEKHRQGILHYGTHPEHRQLFLRKILGKFTHKASSPADQCIIVDE